MKKNFKENFNFITNILILLLFIFGAISYADTNGIFIQAKDVVPGTFGEDEGSGDFTFPSNLNVVNEINTKILNATNLSISNSFKYGGVELDDRYVNTGSTEFNERYVEEDQKNSISSEMIINGEITSDDIKNGAIKLEDVSTNEFDQRYIQSAYNPSSLEDDISDLQSQINQINSELNSQKDSITYLIGSEHTISQCEKKGGVVVKSNGEVGKNYDETDFCKFNRNSCPSGWSELKKTYGYPQKIYKWVKLDSRYCSGEVFDRCPSDFSISLMFGAYLKISCNSPNNEFGFIDVNSKTNTYCSYIRKLSKDSSGRCAPSGEISSCYSTITKIGCY